MNPSEPPPNVPIGDGVPASAVETPASLDELRETVVRHAGDGQALYPRGGETSLDYGEPPARPGVAIRTTRLDRVVDYPAADMTITVEAGMTLAALQATLAAEGQRLPLDAPEAERATIGGIFATGTSGPRRFGAGRPRDRIIGVRFVTADGQCVKGGGRVVKNVAGYDLPKLLTGSLGTLGIIGELTLSVRPKPEASAIAWIGFENPEDVETVLDRLNTSRTRPIALELLNRPAAEAVAGSLGLPIADWVLAVGLEDNAASVRWQTEAIVLEVAPGRLEIIRDAQAEPLWRKLVDFPAARLGALSLVANLRPSAVVALVRQLTPDRWAVQAHAGNGIVRAHRLIEDENLVELVPVINDLRRQAVESSGNLVLARCPTAWKDRLRVWGEPRADWPLMARIKGALDPNSLMNPGRFVGTL